MKSLLLILLLPLAIAAQSANTFRQVTFANLGAPNDNNVRFCTDCEATAPCTGGGRGAYAYRVQTGASTFVWNCSDGGPGGGGGSGDVTSDTSTAAVGQAAIFSNTTGKQIGRFTQTGWVRATGGVFGVQANINLATDVVGNIPIPNIAGGVNAGPNTVLFGDNTWRVPAGGGTVLSVNATAPSGFTFTGGPITGTGTLALNFAGGQAANRFLATPNGSAGAMSLRPIVAADILPTVTINRCLRVDASGNIVVASNDCATGGSVNSVAMTVPSFLSVAGSPITTTGTFAVTLANQNANQIFAGPTTGSATQPGFRSLVAADIPNIDAAKINTGTINTARLGSGSADSTTCLKGNSTWATCASSTPGGSPTQFQFNLSGIFGGASNFLFTAGTGQVTLNQGGNGNVALYGKRVTDSSPTGNLIQFQNQAGNADLFKVDVNGDTTVGALNIQSTSGTDGVLTISSPSSGGGLQLSSGTQPTCNSANRFLFWVVAGDTGVKDSVSVCAKAADGSFAWRVLY